MSVNAKIYKEQGGSTMAVLAADGAAIKGQGSALGTPAQAAHIVAAVAITGGETPTEGEYNLLVTAINAIIVALENVGITARS